MTATWIDELGYHHCARCGGVVGRPSDEKCRCPLTDPTEEAA